MSGVQAPTFQGPSVSLTPGMPEALPVPNNISNGHGSPVVSHGTGQATQAMGDNLANNGDQFFTATFNQSTPGGISADFPPFSYPRSRHRNAPVSTLGTRTQTPKPFFTGAMTMGPTSSTGSNQFPDHQLAESFSALNLATPSTMNNKVSSMGVGSVADFILPKVTPNQGPPPPPTTVPPPPPPPAPQQHQQLMMTHSASSPSFATLNSMASLNSGSPVSQLGKSALGLSSANSPNVSPGLSPANSPLMSRRTDSPLYSTGQNSFPPQPNGGKGQQSAACIQENVGGTTYFYSAEDFAPQYQGIALPNFSMYAGLPPHIAHMKVKSHMPQFFMPDEIKMEILNRQAITLSQIDLEQNPEIPAEVDNYHNLFPLEPPPPNQLHKSSTFGYLTSVYKAVSTKDGLAYCLIRVHGFRLVNTKCMALIDSWKKLYHPNTVQLKQVFTTKAFNDHSIVFVYDFHPGVETLMARHFSQPCHLNGFNNPFGMDGSARPYSSGKGVNGPRQHAGLLAESLIWSYIVQLSSALRAIHAAGLACRTLHPSKILIHSKSRLRLNCMGVFDVLTFDTSQGNPLSMMPHYQQEDLVSLGKVVLALACNSVLGIQREHVQTSMELVARNYSADLKNMILCLLTNQNRPRSINDIMPMIGARFYTQLDAAHLRSDVIENELAKEVENGRVIRLLCKMGTINERPEYNLDVTWSETGDRYMLKLFRDYLFHNVDQQGAPWIDMAHILQCLNKLDAGVPEKLCLMSRDEQNVIVISYTELKQCFESAYNELLSASHSNDFA